MKFIVRRAAFAVALVALTTSVQAETTTLCGEKVDYRIVQSGAGIPANLRHLPGIWVGEVLEKKLGEL